jgi:hypothetical protein
MSRIAADFFASSPVLFLPLLALALFLVVFLGACVAAFRLPKSEASRRASLPLAKEYRRD